MVGGPSKNITEVLYLQIPSRVLRGQRFGQGGRPCFYGILYPKGNRLFSHNNYGPTLYK